MNVLIVNASDIEGGAARAAYRLHCALLGEGVDSRMLVQRKASDDYLVIGPSTKKDKVLAKLRPVLDVWPVRSYKQRTQTLFSTAWFRSGNMVDQINALDPDIVHLHWIAGGMIRIEDIPRIKAPVVWSLHDMWPFTGGCHYDENCGAFKQQCGNCKVLKSARSRDLSRRIYQRKQAAFKRKQDIVFVGLSRWMADEAASSTLFSSDQVVNLPNPIDTEVFSPFDPIAARQLLNLPLDKKLILFGAMGATSDPRKGYLQLSQALQKLQGEEAELVVFGASAPEQSAGFSQKVHYLGEVRDDLTLRVLYNAADVMVVPSLQENLSNAIMESLACGTPVVAFDIGGNRDMINHLKNGYLAKANDTYDLLNGIICILSSDIYECFSKNARFKVVSEFDQKIIANKYIDLYKNILVSG